MSDLEDIINIIKDDVSAEIFALVKDDSSKGYSLKRLPFENEANKKIKSQILSGAQSYISGDSNDSIIDGPYSIDEYGSHANSIYCVDLNSEDVGCIKQFEILNSPPVEMTKPSSIDGDIKGYFIRIKSASRTMWVFQNVSNNCITNAKRQCIFFGSALREVNEKIFVFSDNISFIICDGKLYFKKINVLQSKFNFDSYIKNKASATLDLLKSKDYIDGVDKLEEVYQKDGISCGKKLMNIGNSKVLTIPISELNEKIKKSGIYSKLIKIEDNKIILSTKTSVYNFIKLCNDQYLVSEITGESYDAISKNNVNLENIEK